MLQEFGCTGSTKITILIEAAGEKSEGLLCNVHQH